MPLVIEAIRKRQHGKITATERENSEQTSGERNCLPYDFSNGCWQNEYETAKETMCEAIADGYISTEDCPYIEDVVQGVAEKRAALDDFIMAHAKGWKLERINPVDRNLIRLCLYEIQYLKDVPFEVAIDEAVELAKSYGEEESYAFVNGILDNAKTLVADDQKNEV